MISFLMDPSAADTLFSPETKEILMGNTWFIFAHSSGIFEQFS
jgi:hypothetical protein